MPEVPEYMCRGVSDACWETHFAESAAAGYTGVIIYSTINGILNSIVYYTSI